MINIVLIAILIWYQSTKKLGDKRTRVILQIAIPTVAHIIFTTINLFTDLSNTLENYTAYHVILFTIIYINWINLYLLLDKLPSKKT